jgi:hypothetical protein
MKGRAAASASSDERTPGSASRANARSDGSELSIDWSAGWATRRVSRSSGSDAARASSSRASEPANVLKFEISSFSEPSSRTRPVATLA